jgi:HPt (histidine-containing phosphotransfer) domain-containing protein
MQEIDPEFAEIFVRDAKKSIEMLDGIIEKGGKLTKGDKFTKGDLRNYVIHTHGMKSALANAGKMDLSDIASKLEQAGRDSDMELITAETPVFLDGLREFVKMLVPQETDDADNEEAAEMTEENKARLKEQLIIMKDACEIYDKKTVDKTLKELRSETWPKEIKELLSLFSEKLLHSDFDEIAEEIDKYL